MLQTLAEPQATQHIPVINSTAGKNVGSSKAHTLAPGWLEEPYNSATKIPQTSGGIDLISRLPSNKGRDRMAADWYLDPFRALLCTLLARYNVFNALVSRFPSIELEWFCLGSRKSWTLKEPPIGVLSYRIRIRIRTINMFAVVLA